MCLRLSNAGKFDSDVYVDRFRQHFREPGQRDDALTIDANVNRLLYNLLQTAEYHLSGYKISGDADDKLFGWRALDEAVAVFQVYRVEQGLDDPDLVAGFFERPIFSTAVGVAASLNPFGVVTGPVAGYLSSWYSAAKSADRIGNLRRRVERYGGSIEARTRQRDQSRGREGGDGETITETVEVYRDREVVKTVDVKHHFTHTGTVGHEWLNPEPTTEASARLSQLQGDRKVAFDQCQQARQSLAQTGDAAGLKQAQDAFVKAQSELETGLLKLAPAAAIYDHAAGRQTTPGVLFGSQRPSDQYPISPGAAPVNVMSTGPASVLSAPTRTTPPTQPTQAMPLDVAAICQQHFEGILAGLQP